MSSFFSETLNKKTDWFWDWVEYNQTHPSELVKWFDECSEQELTIFVNTFTYDIDYNLTAPNEGIWIDELESALSEDSQEDFNNWIIVQGKALWEVAVEESLKRVIDGYEWGSNPKEKVWQSLYKIYNQTSVGNESSVPVTWNGVNWTPRKGHFPGASGYWKYKERFGKFLSYPS